MQDLPIRHVPLNFRLGDWALWRVRLPLQVRQVRLNEATEPDAVAIPPACPPAPGSEGFVLRGHPVAAGLPVMASIAGYLRYVPLQYDHYYIDLSIPFAAYQARFSGKTRSTIHRKIRRFAEACGGDARVGEYRTPEEIRSFLDAALPIAQRSYQERLFGGGMPATPAFAAQAMSLAAKGQVRAYILFDRQVPVAYLYCPLIDAVAYYHYVGYDPDYARWSVGTVLFWQVLERMFGDGGIHFFDFTEGESEQKRQFATHQRKCANVFFVRKRLRYILLLKFHHRFEKSVTTAGNFLTSLGVKQKVRQLMRFGLRR